MKKLPQNIEDTLLDYLDGNLTSPQREAFELSLKNNEALRQRWEEVRMAEKFLSEPQLEHPSKNFTSSVMTRLDQYPVHNGLSIRNGILLLTGIMAVIASAIALVSAGVFNETTTLDLNHIAWTQRYIKQTLPRIAIDGKLVVNTIILLNMALAFVVLDRAILKPFFQKRIEMDH